MNITSIKILFLLILLLGIQAIAGAGILDDIEIVPGIRFWGADIGINYKGISFIPSLTTRLCIWFGGGYESVGYFRDPDGIQYDPYDSEGEPDLAFFDRLEFLWALGIRQGILFDPAKDDNLFEVHLFYRGQYDEDYEDSEDPEYIFLSDLPDSEGILLHTIVAGLFFDTEVIDKAQRKRNGIKADISIEFAPALINEIADYTRATVDIRAYLTLLDLDPDNAEKKNLFNLYICDRFLWDGIVGDLIPIAARQNVGGRSLSNSKGLGGIMRGIDSRRFDGYLKMVNNFDIRMNLPAFWIVVPGIVLYFDIGIADDLNYNLQPEYLHYSTGIGAFVFGLGFDVILYANYWIDGERFTVSFDFKLHF